MKYDWYETLSTITIVFYTSDVLEYFIENSASSGGNKIIISKPVQLTLDLYSLIKDYNLKKYKHKYELILTKIEGKKWSRLTRESNGINYTALNSNVDIIDKIYDETEEKTLLDMFKSIYEEGDDESRKAMNKSFLESGGTVLTTNWDEAKEKMEKKHNK